jgi:RNA polymerase sigma-70 factor, ECF subfamily
MATVLEEGINTESDITADQWATDAYDVQESLQGSGDAFGRLVIRYTGRVYSILYSCGLYPSEVDDCAQDVFFKAWEKLHTLRDPEKFHGWLSSIAKNLGNNFVQRVQRKSAKRLLFDEAVESREKTGAQNVICDEERRKLFNAIDALRPIDKAVLTKFYLEEKSVARVSDECVAPEGTIKRRLHVARHRFRKAMSDDQESAPHPGGPLRAARPERRIPAAEAAAAFPVDPETEQPRQSAA